MVTRLEHSQRTLYSNGRHSSYVRTMTRTFLSTGRVHESLVPGLVVAHYTKREVRPEGVAQFGWGLQLVHRINCMVVELVCASVLIAVLQCIWHEQT